MDKLEMTVGSPPSEGEKELLKKFREKLSDVLDLEDNPERRSDPYLLRWIRARDHDLDKAEAMLRNTIQWRETSGADKIMSNPPDPWFAKTYPFWVDGVDKMGHPLVEIVIGSWDFRLALNDPQKEAHLEGHVIRFFEGILQGIRDSNQDKTPQIIPSSDDQEGQGQSWPNTIATLIVDWKGYSYSQLMHWRALQSTLKMAATYEAHYPEIMKEIHFINCPTIFPLFMALLKPMLAPRTLGKLTCYGGQAEWGPALKEVIDSSQLAHLHGGKRVLAVGQETYNYPY